MKYTIVKQFYNAALDNIFTFFFKIADFFKVLYEALWVFIEIWVSFYLIFYNLIMYIYYLILYAIDRGADESQATYYSWRRVPKRSTVVPKITISKEPNPIPSIYGVTGSSSSGEDSIASKTASSVKSAVSSTVSDIKPFTASSQGKRSFFKLFFEAVSNFFYSLKKVILKPFEVFVNFFQSKVKPVREEEQQKQQKSKSLIDEYLKEYEQKRK